MPIENELSFLVKNIPDLTGIKSEKIEQYYLPGPNDHPIRLRKKGNNFELTYKIVLNSDDKTRKHEVNINITQEMYEVLRPLAQRSLFKTRYYINLPDGLLAELDIFEKDLQGLNMVEVEFPNEEARVNFLAPDWFGEDVSQVEWSANYFLAGKNYQQICELIK